MNPIPGDLSDPKNSFLHGGRSGGVVASVTLDAISTRSAGGSVPEWRLIRQGQKGGLAGDPATGEPWEPAPLRPVLLQARTLMECMPRFPP
jgi:hypothetical protein